jgi:undecaprenyl-diphosphatase
MSIINTLTVFAAKYLIYLMIITVAAWFVARLPKGQRKSVLVFAASTFALSVLFSKVAAHLFYNPRPFMVSHITPLIAHAPGNGFPSDHTLLAAAIAFVVLRFDRHFGTILLLCALLVGLARVHAGVHHLIDIIASIVITGFVAGAVYALQEHIRKDNRKIEHAGNN